MAQTATDTTIQELALFARNQFERRHREADDSHFFARKDDAPEWIQDMCRDSHGDSWPDDTIYQFIIESLDALADSDYPEDAYLEADVYTHDLLEWLASSNTRVGYCDEAMSEFGTTGSILAIIALGQYTEKREVLDSVRSFLEARVDNLNDEDADNG